MKRIIVVIIMCLGLLAAIGYNYGWWQSTEIKADDCVEKITFSQAMAYIDEMEKSHQNVINHPEVIAGFNEETIKIVGGIEFHKEMVRRYQQLRNYIIEVTSNEAKTFDCN